MSSLPNHMRFALPKNMAKSSCAITLAGAMLLPLSPAFAAPAATPVATQAVAQGEVQGAQRLQVTSGTFDILKGGNVTVSGSGFSKDFVKGKSFRLYVVPKGESVAFPPHHPRNYPFYVQDVPASAFAADGTVNLTASIDANYLEANGSSFDVVLGYRDDAEDGWIPADEVRTELKVADVSTVSSPTLSYDASSVNASENTKVTVNGAGFQNISYNGSESLIVAVRAVDPATGKATGPALAQSEAKFTSYSAFFGQYMGYTNGRFSTVLDIPAGTLKSGNSYVVQTFEFNVPEDNDEANSQALSTQAFVPVNGENAKTASPSVSLSTDKVDLSSSTTIRVKGKDFKVPAGATVNVLFSEAEADGNPTGEALDSITLNADRVATGAFETTVNVDGTKLDEDSRYAIFVTINYADGQRERIAADYLTLTGESANKKVRERFADVPTAHANHKAVLWAADQKLIDSREKDWFGVNDDATRGDLTVALYRLAGSPKVDLPATSPYADVKTDDPNYAAYIWARQKGITFGWSDGKFHANASVSNATVAAFLYRFDGKKPVAVAEAPYTDVKVGSAFYREITWAKQQKLQVFPGSEYHPSALVSRGELAGFLMNYKVR